MNKVVIDRSKWRCGGDAQFTENGQRGLGDTYLLNQEGYMCCLGFACKQLSSEVTDKDMLNSTSPAEVPYPIDPLNIFDEGESGEIKDSNFSCEAMDINDNSELTDQERESELINLGESYFLEFIFEGEYTHEAGISREIVS